MPNLGQESLQVTGVMHDSSDAELLLLHGLVPIRLRCIGMPRLGSRKLQHTRRLTQPVELKSRKQLGQDSDRAAQTHAVSTATLLRLLQTECAHSYAARTVTMLLCLSCRSWHPACGFCAGSCPITQSVRGSSGVRPKPSLPATLATPASQLALARWTAEADPILQPNGSAWMILSIRRRTGHLSTQTCWSEIVKLSNTEEKQSFADFAYC